MAGWLAAHVPALRPGTAGEASVAETLTREPADEQHLMVKTGRLESASLW